MVFRALGLVVLAACQPILPSMSVAPAGGQTVTVSAVALATPTMRVQIPSRGADAILTRTAISGDVATWFAVDNISLSFRQGVLVASRGLGFDLMGADASGTLDAFDGAPPPVYRRQMRYLTGDHKSIYLMAGCSMQSAGSELIAGTRTDRFEEQCKARQWTITNQFWRDQAGTIVRSRQWVSPEIGYVVTNLRN